MDRGVTVENPYASVTIPRAQLKDGFLKYYLGEDLTSDTVLYNPSSLPTYSAGREKEQEATAPRAPAAYVPWDGQQKVPTQESWARPYNPYASLKMPRGESPEPFHWKSHEATAAPGAGGSHGSCCCGCCDCCPCCAKACSCCRRCPCVIS
nr:cysteine-rich tail protein 1 [Pogona vitticeps]